MNDKNISQFIDADSKIIMHEIIPLDKDQFALLLVSQKQLIESSDERDTRRTLSILQKNSKNEWYLAAQNNTNAVLCSARCDNMFEPFESVDIQQNKITFTFQYSKSWDSWGFSYDNTRKNWYLSELSLDSLQSSDLKRRYDKYPQHLQDINLNNFDFNKLDKKSKTLQQIKGLKSGYRIN